MARPKKTEGTTTSTSKKSQKKVKLAFKPRFSASQSKTLLLSKQEDVKIGNTIQQRRVPLINGLPLELTIRVGEVYEVTEAQYKALLQLGFIDTPEQLESKIEKAKRVEQELKTNPDANAASLADSLYVDNFVVLEWGENNEDWFRIYS